MAKTPITTKDVADRMAKGEQLNKEQQKFYENNANAVDKELAAISSNDRSNITGNGVKADGVPAAQPQALDFNPLAEPVLEKVYTGQQAGAGASNGIGNIIPEHTFQPPPEEQFTPQSEVSEERVKQQKAEKAKPFNPDMEGASDKEKEQGAEQLAEVIFNIWGQGYNALNNLFKISEKKLNKLQNAGIINTRVEVPYKTGYAPLSAVLANYNRDADGLLIIEEDWKAQVKPLLVEELAKAGHGMSNRQLLLYLVTTKLVNDGVKTYSFISLKRDYLTFAKEQTALHRGNKIAAPIQKPEVIIEQPLEQEPIEDTTLQGQALAKHFPQNIQQPRFGSPERINTTNKLEEKDRRDTKRAAKDVIDSVKESAVRSIKADPPPGQKRKAGRPPGAKNKPKSDKKRKR